jgi:hypothetical protein
MFDIHLPTLILAALPGLVLLVFVHRSWARRVRSLEQDLEALNASVERMNESQWLSQEQTSRGLAEVEERLMELAVPSGASDMPLERRHRVLSLAKQGASVDQISRTLNVPRCEADLILSLQSFASSASSLAGKAGGDPIRHVQA